MSVSNLGPFPLTGIGQQLIIIPSGQYSGPNQLSQVLLTNLSYYTIALTSSTDGTLLNLLPGQVSVYPAPRSGGSLTGVIISGASTPGTTLLAQVGLGDTTFDGSYPYTVALPVFPFSSISLGGSGSPFTFTPSPNATGFLVYSAAQVASALSGFFGYLPITVLYDNPAEGDWVSYVGPIPQATVPSMSAAITITSTVPGDPVSVEEIDAAWTPTAGGVTAYIIAVPNPAAGADWTYTLPAPARLVVIRSALVCSAAAANRVVGFRSFIPSGNPAWQVGPTSIAQTASQAQGFTLSSSTPLTNNVNANLGEVNGSFPNLLLPAGAIVGSVTPGLQGGDQWSQIVLTFSPV